MELYQNQDSSNHCKLYIVEEGMDGASTKISDFGFYSLGISGKELLQFGVTDFCNKYAIFVIKW